MKSGESRQIPLMLCAGVRQGNSSPGGTRAVWRDGAGPASGVMARGRLLPRPFMRFLGCFGWWVRRDEQDDGMALPPSYLAPAFGDTPRPRPVGPRWASRRGAVDVPGPVVPGGDGSEELRADLGGHL